MGGQSSPSFELFSPRTYCWCSQKATVRHIPVALQKSKSSYYPNMCTIQTFVLLSSYFWLVSIPSVAFLPRQHLYYVYCICINVYAILKKTIHKYAFYPKHNRTIASAKCLQQKLPSIDRSTVDHQIYTESQTIIRNHASSKWQCFTSSVWVYKSYMLSSCKEWKKR